MTLRDLVRQALRMRPDRLVVGEVRGAEVADLLAALNTGHDGGCGTLHANRPAEVPARLEALGVAAGLGRAAVHSQAGRGPRRRRAPAPDAGRAAGWRSSACVRRAGDLVVVEPGWRADGGPCPAPGPAATTLLGRRSAAGDGRPARRGGAGAAALAGPARRRRRGLAAARSSGAVRRTAPAAPDAAGARAGRGRGAARSAAVVSTPLVAAAGRRSRGSRRAAVAGAARRTRARERRLAGLAEGLGALAADLRSGRSLDAATAAAVAACGDERERPGAGPRRPGARGRPAAGGAGGRCADALDRISAAVLLSARTGCSLAEVARRRRGRPAGPAPAPSWSCARRPPGRGPARCCWPGCRCWGWRWAAAWAPIRGGVLTTTGTGQVLLVAGVALELAGLAWSRRLVRAGAAVTAAGAVARPALLGAAARCSLWPPRGRRGAAGPRAAARPTAGGRRGRPARRRRRAAAAVAAGRRRPGWRVGAAGRRAVGRRCRPSCVAVGGRPAAARRDAGRRAARRAALLARPARRLRPARRCAWPPGCRSAARWPRSGGAVPAPLGAAAARGRGALPAGRRAAAGLGGRRPASSPALGRVLVRAGESGAAVAPALRSLAADCRAAARAATEAAVRRAGVWVLAPLGLCFLPAFVCLGVVPLVLGIAGDVFG